MKTIIDITTGWDGIEIGTQHDEIDEVLDRGQVKSRYSDVYFVDYKTKGISISYGTNSKKATAIFLYNKDLGYEDYGVFDLETSKSINWGSTREDIINAYGKPKSEFEFTIEAITGSRMVYEKFDFRVIDNVIRRIAIY